MWLNVTLCCSQCYHFDYEEREKKNILSVRENESKINKQESKGKREQK